MLNDKTSVEFRYYISSCENHAESLGKGIRSHWGIENKVHHILDVAYREDSCIKSRVSFEDPWNCFGYVNYWQRKILHAIALLKT